MNGGAMKTLPFLASLIIVFFWVAPKTVEAQKTQVDDTGIIDRYISRQAQSTHCDEYKDARKVLRGDVNGDGTDDVVALYTLEGCDGANNYAQNLAVFLRKRKSIQYAANAVVGGKLNRSVELISISSGRINLDTMDYSSSDPACCPSRPGKTRYIFSKRKLHEVK